MKTRLKWIAIAAISLVVGLLVYDSVPERLYAYPRVAVSPIVSNLDTDAVPERLHAYSLRGREMVPAFSPLARAGLGCIVAFACLAWLSGIAYLTHSTVQNQRALLLATVAGWSLVGLVTALAWSLVDANMTFLALPNSEGLGWAFARAAILGVFWLCAVAAVPLALCRWRQATCHHWLRGQLIHDL